MKRDKSWQRLRNERKTREGIAFLEDTIIAYHCTSVRSACRTTTRRLPLPRPSSIASPSSAQSPSFARPQSAASSSYRPAFSAYIYIIYLYIYIYVYVNSCGVDTNSLWSHSRARQSTQAVGQSHGGQLQSSLHVPRVGHAGHVQPTAATTAVVQTGSFPLTRVLAKLYQNYINIEWVLDKASMSYACGPRCPTNERSSPGKLFFNNQ